MVFAFKIELGMFLEEAILSTPPTGVDRRRGCMVIAMYVVLL